MAVNTWDDYIGVLQKSGLLGREQMAEARRITEGMTEPTRIARRLVQEKLLSHWQASQLLAGKHSLVISKYRLLDLLGTEPLGPVFLAEHTQMDRRVVLKTLATRDGNSAASIERFLGEAQSLATLDHRNLSHIYDVDREGDFYYLIMEYVQGRTLAQIVAEQGPLPCEVAAGFAALVADALAHAHQQGIFHHGLRPDRLVVDTQETLKVLDIGVARLSADEGSPESGPGGTSGAFGSDYLAPEQVLREKPLDHRADLYALGCILYFMLAGEPPFGSDSDPQKRCTEPPPDVSEVRPDVPHELAAICTRLLARRPRDRYGSAADAAGALEEWLKTAESESASSSALAAAAFPRGNGSFQEEAFELAPTRIATTDRPLARQGQDSLMRIWVGAGATIAIVVGIIAAFVLNRSNDPVAAHREGEETARPAPLPVPTVPQDADGFLPIDQLKVNGPDGVAFQSLSNGVQLASGVNPPTATYRVEAQVEAPEITGLKLEAIPQETQAHQGSGRSPTGSFRISNLGVEVADDQSFQAAKTVKIGGVTTAAGGTDPPKFMRVSSETIPWAPASKFDQRQSATLWFAEPVSPSKPDAPICLRLVVDQQEGGQQTLGQFRLIAVTKPAPVDIGRVDLGETMRSPGSTADALAYWRFEKPADEAAKVNGEPAVEDSSGHGNPLFAPTEDTELKYSSEVPPGASSSNLDASQSSYDQSQPPPDGVAVRGLSTNLSKSKPRGELAATQLNQWTIELSFRLARLGLTHGLLGKEGTADSGWRSPLQLRARGDDNRLELEVLDVAGKVHILRSDQPLVAGRWYHVAISADGTNLRFQLDEGKGFELQDSAIAFSGPLARGRGEWTVGRGYFDGKPADDAQALLDEVRISAGVIPTEKLLFYRSPEQIAEAKSPPPTTNSADTSKEIKYHVLRDLTIQSQPPGVEFERQPDGSYLASETGTNPEAVEYIITAKTDITGMRGVRLEVFPDRRLPGNGPGRCVDDPSGNFVLTSFTLSFAGKAGERLQTSLPLTAEADFSQPSFEVAGAVDTNAATGWAVAPELGKGHYARFSATAPFGYQGGTWLTMKLDQKRGRKLTIGRFRLSVWTGEEPGEAANAGVLAANQSLTPFATLKRVVPLPDLPTDAAPGSKAPARIELGDIYSLPQEDISVWLIGFEVADPDGSKFVMRRVAGKANQWEIRLRPPNATGDTDPVIAEVVVKDHKAHFRWKDEALRLPASNYLRNCMLEFVVGEEGSNQKQSVALREPIETSGIEIPLSRGRVRAQYEIPWMPKAERVRIELTPGKKYPANSIGDPLRSGRSETIEMTFTPPEKPAGQPPLTLVVDRNIQRVLQINSAFYITTGDKRSIFSRPELNKLGKAAFLEVKRLKARKASYDALPGRGVDVNKLPEPTKQEIAALPKMIADSEAHFAALAALKERIDALEKAGPVPFHIYLALDDEHQVKLIDGGATTAATPKMEDSESAMTPAETAPPSKPKRGRK